MTVSPSCIYVSMPAGHGTTPFSIDDLCHTEPFAFRRVLSIAVIERSTNPSTTNRYPIIDILSLISIEMTFNRLSNVRLHGMDTRPHANASLRLYTDNPYQEKCVKHCWNPV